MRLAHLLATALVALATACSDQRRAATRSALESGKADLGITAPSRTAVLQFEAKKPGTRPYPFPFVELKVGTVTTRFLVDTAATAHSVDSAVVTSAGLAAPVHGAQFTLEGWGALPDQPIAVTDLSADLRAHGIGGLLSPSLLAQGVPEDRAVVVDLVRAQLRAQPRSAAWPSVEDLGLVLTTAGQHFCAGGVVTLDGTIDGEATRLGVGTTTSRSFLLPGSKAASRATARPMLGRSITVNDAAELPVTLRGGVPITLAGWSTTTDLGVAEAGASPPCGQEGRLGMDVLQRCALAMTRDELVLGCRPPASR